MKTDKKEKLTPEQIEALKQIKALLPYGSQQKVADRINSKRTGPDAEPITINTVNRVLNLRWYNQDVVNACLEIIKEQREAMKELVKSIS